MMDDGHITDSQGRKVDFKNTIIVMTSNIGSGLLNLSTTFFLFSDFNLIQNLFFFWIKKKLSFSYFCEINHPHKTKKKHRYSLRIG